MPAAWVSCPAIAPQARPPGGMASNSGETHSWTKGIIDLNQNNAITSDYNLYAADGRRGQYGDQRQRWSILFQSQGGEDKRWGHSVMERCEIDTLLGAGSDPICGGAPMPCTHTSNTAGVLTHRCTLFGHAAAGMTGMVVGASAKPPHKTGFANQRHTIAKWPISLHGSRKGRQHEYGPSFDQSL